nr:uncharacterized protein LOC114107136 isoform X2 [Marmota flaviventris]
MKGTDNTSLGSTRGGGGECRVLPVAEVGKETGDLGFPGLVQQLGTGCCLSFRPGLPRRPQAFSTQGGIHVWHPTSPAGGPMAAAHLEDDVVLPGQVAPVLADDLDQETERGWPQSGGVPGDRDLTPCGKLEDAGPCGSAEPSGTGDLYKCVGKRDSLDAPATWLYRYLPIALGDRPQ